MDYEIEKEVGTEFIGHLEEGDFFINQNRELCVVIMSEIYFAKGYWEDGNMGCNGTCEDDDELMINETVDTEAVFALNMGESRLYAFNNDTLVHKVAQEEAATFRIVHANSKALDKGRGKKKTGRKRNSRRFRSKDE